MESGLRAMSDQERLMIISGAHKFFFFYSNLLCDASIRKGNSLGVVGPMTFFLLLFVCLFDIFFFFYWVNVLCGNEGPLKWWGNTGVRIFYFFWYSSYMGCEMVRCGWGEATRKSGT